MQACSRLTASASCPVWKKEPWQKCVSFRGFGPCGTIRQARMDSQDPFPGANTSDTRP
jgi:hypothetical protein